ncbi:hypothetical protein [Ruania halotolerans]|uniref:hypothetical protein n=1 Tax=Ruania halotolerans TaxID=2897773 RepID=UPI001E376034|nr:hypothetical protein [Ruania halotolerans]UFU05555.1 hypothetical protein LQF10_14015 [Ruania halotolerans]
MVALQIRDIPEQVRDVLAKRAQEKGQSLTAYLRDVVLREAKFADNVGVIDEIAARPRPSEVTVEEILAAQDAARAHTDR